MRIHTVFPSALLLFIAVGTTVAAAPPKPRDYTSKVPAYRFGDTVAEQEAQLRTNPLLARFAESRRQNLQDPHHPIYHYVAPENRMNDPNGLCFWQGRWHLFYQGYPPEDPRQHWGHAVSDDLVHWRDLPYAIYPNPEDKCFSGSALAEDDRVIAIYHGIAAGTMVAVSTDPLLLNWKKVTGQAVIPLPKPGEPKLPYNIFDPCLWKQGDFYYALTAGTLPDGPGGKPVRAEFLHRSRDLAAWQYLHPFLENDRYGLVGDDGACPYFWPIGDRHMLLHFSHMSGGKYLLGNYDTGRDKFVVTDGGDFNFGPYGPSGTHAPSACPDGKGGLIVIFNMNPGKPTRGWNQIMTLPRRLTLPPKPTGDPLCIEPAGDIASLRNGHQHLGPVPLPANEEVVLEAVRGSAMELAAEIAPQGNQTVELNVLRSPGGEEATRIVFYRDRGYRRRGRPGPRPSVISIDTSRSSTLPDVTPRPPETCEVALGRNEPLKLRVFLDRSVVEVFANGRQCAAVRVYPGRDDSTGVSLRALGRDAVLTSLNAWQMKSIYDAHETAATASTNDTAATAAAETAAAAGDADDDILIADFEGKTYGEGWKVEGAAFGKGPAGGTLPGQMKVTGFEGKGLVNSFLGRDGPTGTLTSPPFTIERDYITFLIGGGGYKGKTCMNLLVDGRVVLSASGPNTQPGGSEFLNWENWDVRKYKGRKAVIQIVDNASGGWGHINVDQIAQSNTPAKKKPFTPPTGRGEPPPPEKAREVQITGKYLILPVSNKGKRGRMTVTVGGQLVHNLDCDFPPDKDAVDWWTYLNMEEYAGKTAAVVARAAPEVCAMIASSDEIPHLQPLYDEALRPQFHMSPMRGWNNDPNGMCWYDGLYHFFWQCNPAGPKWANMYWGHATSPDMIHWTEQDRALRPFGGNVANRHPSMAVKNCFSGSGHVDVHNTAGWQKGDARTMVLAFTDTGCGEALAYSTDRGKTWTYYEGNPIIRHSGRDPKLAWYEPGKHWVIAVFDQDKEHGRNIAFYTSKDLKEWTCQSHLPGYFECPELFELPVDGDPARKKWVIFGADARYAVGRFDGKTFTPDHEGKHRVHWGAYYASQCFSHPPDGRVVQIGWARIGMPGMPFNQTFTVPTRLTLRTTDDGIRMFAAPIKELEQLRKPGPKTAENVELNAGKPAVTFDVKGQLFDILVTLGQGTASKAVLRFGDNAVTYDFAAGKLDEMPLAMKDGEVTFRVLVDRPMVEVIGGGGACFKTSARRDMGKPIGTVSLTAEGGSVAVKSLEVFELKSAWK